MEALTHAGWWTARLLTGFVLVASLIPLIRSGEWPIRIFDFPRVQMLVFAGVAGGLVVAVAAASAWRGEAWVLLGLLAVASLIQAYGVLHYTPVWPKSVSDADSSDFTLLVSNLDFRNDSRGEAIETLLRQEADVVLLVEVDDRWWEALAPLRERYEHSAEEIAPMGLGLALLSRHPIEDVNIRRLISDRRPSIWCRLVLPDERHVRFAGIHPTPPALPKRNTDDEERYDSRIRDAELALVAGLVAEHPDEPWIVAGDFNDVAWSHTTNLFQELSGLLDPRIGRGMINTFHAEYPLFRFPLDHVFVAPGFRVGRFDRVRVSGSDHFAVRVELQLENAAPGPEPEADSGDRAEAEEAIEEGVEDASENGERP